MKKYLFILGLLFLWNFTMAQSDYRVVFDLTSKDTTDQRAVIRWIREITSTNPDAQVEVVLYSQAVDFVVKNRSAFESTVADLTNNKNVSFKICAIAMKNHNIDKAQLITGVQTVPDGIYEIISKQRQGWGYIKAKN